ncbi:MAG: hypothetical protein KBB52_00700 [Candidatus Omnitrophica bacterium]|nr:hypothetical protein [Candidatus Omnitrophota bacterium]
MGRSGGSETTNVWVQKIGIVHIIIFAMKGIFCRYAVYYDVRGIDVMTGWFIGLLRKSGLCGNFYPEKFLLAEKEGEGFASVQSMFKDLDKSIDNFVAKHYAAESDRLKRTIKSYVAYALRNNSAFMIAAGRKADDTKGGRNLFCIRRHPLNHILIDYYVKELGLLVGECGLRDVIMFYLTSCLSICSSVLFACIPERTIRDAVNVKPSIWVEYAPLDILDFSFWSDFVDRSDFDIVAYFDRPDYGDMDKIKSKVISRGFKWVQFNHPRSARLGKVCLRRLFRGLPFRGYRGLPLWAHIFRVEYQLTFLLYEAIFKRFKVKILIQHQEAAWKQNVQAAAVESAGGIMIGYNWSIYYFRYLPTHTFPQHVYFVWGNEVGRCIEKIDKPKCLLPSGLWITYDAKDAPAALESLDKGIAFKIAIFDNSTGQTTAYSPEMLLRFYVMLLRLLADHRDWGGIIKSKSYDTAVLGSFAGGEEVVAQMEALIASRRLVVLDRNYSPLAASSNADISVCFGLNTAGIISGIHGLRSIHWDCGGIVTRVENAEYYKDIAYVALEDLSAAILKAAAGDRSVGDFSKWRQQFNYFDDFRAAERVGDFIQTYMTELLQTGDVHQSLARSVQRYNLKNNYTRSSAEVVFAKA